MLPILYSFRRCPYAIRTRMTLSYTAIDYELREVSLKCKPAALLNASAKATVPTMVLSDSSVIDESTDIINWSLQKSDPAQWLRANKNGHLRDLMAENDQDFKQHLDHYKYADRHPQHPAAHYRDQAGIFLQKLENSLKDTPFLLDRELSLADVFIFPFIRQFAFVDKPWFDQAPLPALQKWLKTMLASELFNQVMKKYSIWCENDEAVIISQQR